MREPKKHMERLSAELVADLISLHREYGYINQDLYSIHGRFARQALVKRFGSFDAVCQLANLKCTGRMVRKEVECTWCVNCDVTYERPAGDKSHRLCKTCRRNRNAYNPIADDSWAYIA